MTHGITTLGTIVPGIMILGTTAHGLGVGAFPTILGTQAITGGHITTAAGAGAGMEEAGMEDIGDILLYIIEAIEEDMLHQALVAEVDGPLQTMLADVLITDLLLMALQAMVAEAEISIVEQVV